MAKRQLLGAQDHPSIRAILFDLDETLLDRNASVELYLKDLHLRYALDHVPYETYRDRFHELDRRGYADKREVFQALIAEFAISARVEELVADFRQNAWKRCKTFCGTKKVLRALRAHGYKLGIITNGSVEAQSVKLLESGLSSLVDVTLISAQEKVKKPDAAIFERAAERLGVGVTESVFVGDNPQTDIGGANQAGMKTVWLKSNLPWPEHLAIVPCHTVSTLEELLGIEF